LAAPWSNQLRKLPNLLRCRDFPPRAILQVQRNAQRRTSLRTFIEECRHWQAMAEIELERRKSEGQSI
jgi:hypothetical protein